MGAKKKSSGQIPISLQFWRSDEVQDLTLSQRGALMDAIAMTWDAPVPGYFCEEVRKHTAWFSDLNVMEEIGCDEEDWRRLTFLGLIAEDPDGHWHIPQMVPWAEKAQRTRAARSRAGSLGAASRWAR